MAIARITLTVLCANLTVFYVVHMLVDMTGIDLGDCAHGTDISGDRNQWASG